MTLLLHAELFNTVRMNRRLAINSWLNFLGNGFKLCDQHIVAQPFNLQISLAYFTIQFNMITFVNVGQIKQRHCEKRTSVRS
jgi:hypothetical protein